MTLFRIAKKNVKSNFTNYFSYFISLVFVVMIYFIFTVMQFNDTLNAKAESSRTTAVAMKTSGIILVIFALVFIFYSNSFFTKKRKKEIALYNLFGLKKKEIGMLMFFENIIMGIFALLVGILLGTILSKLFTMMLLRVMKVVDNVEFFFSFAAVTQVTVVFIILFLLTSIQNYFIIYRYKLLELFKAENQGEEIPKSSWIVAILGVGFIAYGYYLSLNLLQSTKFMMNSLIILLTVVIGTYLTFSSFIIFMIKIIKRNKKYFYNGMNIIATSTLLYRIRKNARTLATIAILSATTITGVGVAISLYYTVDKLNEKSYPFDYSYARAIEDSSDENFHKGFDEILNKYKNHDIKEDITVDIAKAWIKLPSYTDLSDLEELESQSYIMSESEYNKVRKAQGNEESLTLEKENDVFLIIVNAKIDKDIKNKEVTIEKENNQDNIGLKEDLYFTAVGVSDKEVIGGSLGGVTIVVKDSAYEKLKGLQQRYQARALNIENSKESYEEGVELREYVEKYSENSGYIWFTAKQVEYKESFSQIGIIVFAATFLGIAFLISTGSIIMLKQLSEAEGEKQRYKTLKNIGVSKGEVKISLYKQIGFVFVLPLVFGITHSIFALKILSILLPTSILNPVLLSIGVYTVVYFVYYLFTVKAYYRIVYTNN